MAESEVTRRLLQLAARVAGQECDCYYTMGQVRHICAPCEAESILELAENERYADAPPAPKSEGGR